MLGWRRNAGVRANAVNDDDGLGWQDIQPLARLRAVKDSQCGDSPWVHNFFLPHGQCSRKITHGRVRYGY